MAVLGAVGLHAPILRYDLLRPLKSPIDGGRGVFGANKTWRGALVVFGFVGVAAVHFVVSELAPRWARRCTSTVQYHWHRGRFSPW